MTDDAERHAADDADRHRDDDRAQRHHGAVPLAEHHQVGEAGADQQRQLPVARIVPEQHHPGDQRDPGNARKDLHGIAADARQEPGRQHAFHQRIGLFDQPGDAAGKFLEGEQAEIETVDQPLHERGDPAGQG